ncbi:MAG: phasin family protein [Chloroflexota bacterium]
MVKRSEHEPLEETSGRSGFAELSRKILLAGIGAAALAQEEIERFVNRLVEKGELAEKDARRMIQEIMEKREKMEQERRAAAQKSRPAPVTHADIEALSAKIAELSRKIEELRKERGE